jgi:hypothetical protein
LDGGGWKVASCDVWTCSHHRRCWCSLVNSLQMSVIWQTSSILEVFQGQLLCILHGQALPMRFKQANPARRENCWLECFSNGV